MDATNTFKHKAAGRMLSGAMPTNAKVAKYADAPPWPTDENNNAAKKISGIINKTLSIIIEIAGG